MEEIIIWMFRILGGITGFLLGSNLHQDWIELNLMNKIIRIFYIIVFILALILVITLPILEFLELA